MLRILRAFAWMRWRVLMNSIERTSARDTIERLSLAVEQIGPIIALGLMVPSALALAGLAGYAGYQLPTQPRVLTFDVIGVVLGLAFGFCFVGPLMMPSMERTSAVRLLLLPIPRRTLYVAQVAGGLTDPWVLLAIPILIGVAVGLAAAGAIAAAAIAVIAGLLLLAIFIGATALATFVLHLIVRDRRRGELLALLFIIIVPTLALLPTIAQSQKTREERRAERTERAERLARGEEIPLGRAVRFAARAYGMLPSQVYVTAARSAAHHETERTALPLAALGLGGLVLHAFGLLAFGRLLDSPATASRRQAAKRVESRAWRIPGVSRPSAAVAHTQVRLALRTPRGRSILLGPLLVFGVMAIMMSRGGRVDLGALALNGGLGLAIFGVTFYQLAILPFAMNQFAIDRAGLTLAFLSPASSRELLVGKAIGNGLIAGVPGLLCVALAFVVFHDGRMALWASIPVALVAISALVAPGAAILSTLFPRTVDLNSIGRGSDAHGLAGLLGLFLFAVAALPSIVLAIVALAVLRRPDLLPLFLLVWAAIALAIGRLLLHVVVPVFDRRRENLALVAG